MTANRLPDYLDHMRQAIEDVQSFTEDMAQADFMQDKRTQQAVVMSLIVLGEACDQGIGSTPCFRRAIQTNPVAQHARHAQPDRSWLLRHQP